MYILFEHMTLMKTFIKTRKGKEGIWEKNWFVQSPQGKKKKSIEKKGRGNEWDE